MRLTQCLLLIILTSSIHYNCTTTSSKQLPLLVNDTTVVQLNQMIYSSNIPNQLQDILPQYKIVWAPKAVQGNYAVVVKNNDQQQYVLIIRGSLIALNNEAFYNWVLQDFNIFTQQKWTYTDTAAQALIANGAAIAFNNMLQLTDTATGNTLEQYIDQIHTKGGSLVISGHSLGGNIAQVYASYIASKYKNRNWLQLCTFGATAAGNAAFVHDMEVKYPKGKRYEIQQDVATKFPSTQVFETLKGLGLYNRNGINEQANNTISSIVDIATTVVNVLDIIPENRKYVQSKLHQITLNMPNDTRIDSTSNIVERVYYYHKIDKYAQALGITKE